MYRHGHLTVGGEWRSKIDIRLKCMVYISVISIFRQIYWLDIDSFVKSLCSLCVSDIDLRNVVFYPERAVTHFNFQLYIV